MLKQAHRKLYILFFFLGIIITAQTGPGGVGKTDGTSSLILWLNPDVGSNTGTAWADQSGNGYDFASTIRTGSGATLNTADTNDYNSYSFNGSNNYFEKSFESTLNPNAFSLFTVSNVTAAGSHKALVSSRDDPPGSATAGFILYAIPGSHRWSFWNGRAAGGWQQTGNTLSTSGSWATQNLFYENTAGGKRLFLNNTLNGTSTHSMTANTTQVFRVGAGRNENTTPNYYFNGKMGEIVMFNVVLNSAQRIIINNYQSAKYNFLLTSDDFYDEDTTGGNFDHDVAGIGQATDGTNHTDSQGTGIVRINTPSSISNGDFLFWGEDVKDATYAFAGAGAIDNYRETINTKWRVSHIGDLGTVSVHIAQGDIPLSISSGCNNLKLIVSSSSTFATKTTYDLVLSSGVYTATGVSFTDNDYFTIEHVDQIVLDGATAYNGAGASNKPNTNDDCYKLLVKSNTLSLSEDADVREIEVESSSILAVDSGIRLQVTNGINNNGDIRLVGTSQLVQTHTTVANLNTGSGNLHVDQTANTSSIYHSGYWSSPVSIGASYAINDVLKDGSVPTAATATAGEAVDIDFIAGHDGSSASSPIEISTRWLAIFNNATDWTRFVSPTATVLTPGLGWNMKSVGSTFTFKGIPNDGEYSFPIAVDNYSLLGNPYPSALDAEAFITQNAGEFNGELYIYNSISDNTHVRGNYTGTYSTIVSGVSVGAGRYLPIGQAFFVTREVAGTGNITFRNSQRTLTTLSDTDGIIARNSQKRKSNISEDLPVLKIGFKFDLSGTEKRSRQVAVAFRGLTNNYDRGFDAEMWGLQSTDMYLKVNDRESPFIITGVENFDASHSIPLVVQLDEQREVAFSLDEKQNIPSPVYLFDSHLNIFYDLSEIPQVLNLSSGEYTDRFFITFKKSTLNTEDTLLSKGFTIYNKRETKELVINNNSTSDIEKITIYNLLGQKLIEVDDSLLLNKKQLIINTKKLRNTVYIVTIKTTEGIISKKII